MWRGVWVRVGRVFMCVADWAGAVVRVVRGD